MTQKEEEIWTVEVNIGDDVSLSTSYHIDTIKNTCRTNLRHTISKSTGNKDSWILIGLAKNISEANDLCSGLHKLICKERGEQVKSINFELEEE